MGAEADNQVPRETLAARVRRAKAAVAAGRALRAKNRELLLQREASRQRPKHPVATGLTVILAGLYLVPLFVLGAHYVIRVESLFGEVAGAIVGAVAMALAAFAVYHAPEIMRSFASQFSGLTRMRGRKLETPWATIIVLILLPAVFVIALFGR